MADRALSSILCLTDSDALSAVSLELPISNVGVDSFYQKVFKKNTPALRPYKKQKVLHIVFTLSPHNMVSTCNIPEISRFQLCYTADIFGGNRQYWGKAHRFGTQLCTFDIFFNMQLALLIFALVESINMCLQKTSLHFQEAQRMNFFL